MDPKALGARALVIGVAVLGLGAGAWWLQAETANPHQDAADAGGGAAALPEGESGKVLEGAAPSGTPVTAEVIATSVEPPASHTETYRNEKYGFEYRHTPQAVIKEFDEGGGAMTIVHENFEKVRGVQIFILPYAEATISEERFHADVPSGVRENVESTTLDGIPAVTFNSFDASLGETREIWVIHNGYLYEITTMKGVGNWFTPVIQSWNFTR